MTTDNFTFFWGTSSPFSNWHKSKFMHNDIEYNTSEQYMMHMKALMFNDTEVAELIMTQKDPRKQKMLGREVRGFVQSQWEEKCVDIMVEGLVSKFSQNAKMLAELLDSGDTIIVEASPYDKVWGIGLTEDDPRAKDPSQWQGKNLLGITLMKVRDVLKSTV